MKKYDYYIFDFDGTLIDSCYSLYLVYKKAFESCGVSITEEECYNVFMKESIEISYARKLDINDKERYKKFEDIINTYITSEEVLHANRLMEDTVETLTSLVKEKRKLAIVSSNSHDHMPNVLSYLGIDPSIFSFYIGYQDVKTCKPDPQGINIAISRFNDKKDKMCYVGDSFNDVKAATQAGIDPIFVIRKHNKDDKTLPCRKITSLLDLVK